MAAFKISLPPIFNTKNLGCERMDTLIGQSIDFSLFDFLSLKIFVG